MNIQWDETRCARLGVCSAIAPEVFTTSDGGDIDINTGAASEYPDAVANAAESCPTQAIRIDD